MSDSLAVAKVELRLVTRRFSGRSLLSTVVVAIFALLFALGAVASTKATRIGMTGTWIPSLHTWRVTDVTPVSPAGDQLVMPGDIVLTIDGDPPVAPAGGSDHTLEAAKTATVFRPVNGQVIAVNANAHSLNWKSVLVISLAFFAVGAMAITKSANPSSLALALTTLTAAAELAILPAVYRQDSWSFPIHSLLVPLFMASFANLFLTFPLRRRISLRGLVVPTWLIPLTAIPFGAVSYYAMVIRPGAYHVFRAVGAPYLLLWLIVGVISLLWSWKETTDIRIRTQIRLVVFGSLISILPFLLLSVLPEATMNKDILATKYTVICFVLMPLSFGYAILRYQIMDLQLFIRRGIVYSVLALAVTAVYALILFIGTTVIQHQFGINDVVVLAVSGTTVAIIFQRLRDELQRRVDRIFDKSHYNYRAQLLEFSRRMTEKLGDEDLGQVTAAMIAQTLEPTFVRVYLCEQENQLFRLTAGVGTPAAPASLELSTRNPMVADLERDSGTRQRFDALPDEDAVSILLVKEKDTVGLLMLGPKKADLPYSSDDLALLRTVANQLAVAADNSRLYEHTRDLYISSIRTLAATVDAKDPYTHGHSERVSAYARAIAGAMDLEREDKEAIELAGLLHDIGKIGIPDSILQKPGRLDPDEREMIMEHAALGAKIISENPALMPLAPLVRHHHEWFNGAGYPDGLAGSEIPLGAAIISVADTFDTMTTDRPYRAAPGREQALAELQRCAGTQFHPEIVAAFLDVYGFNSDLEGSIDAAHQQLYSLAGRISTVDTRAMRVVYKVVQTIGEVTDLTGFITRVTDLIHRELGTGQVNIYLKDALSDSFVCQTAENAEPGVVESRIEAGKGLVGWVAEHCVPARVDDVHHDARGNEGRHPSTRSHVAVPLVIDDKTIGVIDVQSRRAGSFTSDDIELLMKVAQQLAQVVEVAQLHDQVKKNSVLDGLTGVANHRYFYQRLEEEIMRAGRSSGDVSLILIDVDELKSLNDTHGHVAGDAALRVIAGILERESRGSDIVARYGGDEFAIILPDSDETGALQYAARMERTISETTFALHGEHVPLPSISWGHASVKLDGDRAVSLVAAADARMYHFKFTVSKANRDPLAATGT